MADEIVDIVDENDNVLYPLGRKEAFKQNLRCRVVHAFLTDRTSGKLMLLVRGKNLSFRPLHYGAVGGFAQTGETLSQAIQREVLEEVGLATDLHFLGKYPATDPSNGQVFIDAVFTGMINAADVKIDANDVERVEFLSLAEVTALLANEPKLHPLLAGQVALLQSGDASLPHSE